MCIIHRHYHCGFQLSTSFCETMGSDWYLDYRYFCHSPRILRSVNPLENIMVSTKHEIIFKRSIQSMIKQYYQQIVNPQIRYHSTKISHQQLLCKPGNPQSAHHFNLFNYLTRYKLHTKLQFFSKKNGCENHCPYKTVEKIVWKITPFFAVSCVVCEEGFY